MKQIVIVGAGASGLFCAFLLAKHGKKVVLLEAEHRVGRKLSGSGGGRANFSNRHAAPDKYLCSGGNAFCAPALEKYSWQKAVKQTQDFGLRYEERARGRFFLLELAARLVSILETECARFGAEIACGRKAIGLDCGNGVVICENGKFPAESIILAQGTPAAGKLAGAGWAMDLAVMAGHTRIPYRPGLVPLLYGSKVGKDAAFGNLAGISLPVKLSLMGQKHTHDWMDDLLFTHNGLSGPAILDASLYWRSDSYLQVDFWPAGNFEKILDEKPRQTPRSSLARLLPARLVDVLLPEELAFRKNGQISRSDRKKLSALVHAHKFVLLQT